MARRNKRAKEDKRRCGIYVRVSSDMQESNFSISAQIRICRELAERRSWGVIAVYTDIASGRNTERSNLQRLLKDAQDGQFDFLVAYAMDRVSRSVENMLTIIRQLEDFGVLFVSATEPFDFTTPYGRVHLTMISTFNELYSNRLADEVMKGQREKVRQGGWIGGVPYGYKMSASGDLVPNENAEAVTTAFNMVANGYSSRGVAQRLNEEGYKPARADSWDTSTVSYMVKNRSYAGFVSYQGEWRKGKHVALVTEAQFEMTRSELANRSNPGITRAKPKSHTYILSGLVQCAEGVSARSAYNCKEGKYRYRYYRCSKNEKKPSTEKCACGLGNVSADAVEKALGILLSNIQLPEDWRGTILERLSEAQDRPKVDRKREKKKLQTELERLTAVFVKFGHITEDVYLKKRAVIEGKIANLYSLDEESGIDYDQAAQILSNFSTLWGIASQEDRQKLAQKLIQRATITVISKIRSKKHYRLDVLLNPSFRLLITPLNILSITFRSYRSKGRKVVYEFE